MLKFVLNIWIQFNFIFAFHQHQDFESVSIAISDVVFELFVKSNIHFDLIDFNNTPLTDKIISRLNRKNFGEIKIKLKTSIDESPRVTFVNMYKSSIFLTPSTVKVNNFYKSWEFKFDDTFGHPYQFSQIFKFLNFVSSDFNLNEIIFKQPNHRFGHPSQFSYFLKNKKKEIDLISIEWWTEKACNQEQHVVINTFDKLKSKWNQKLEIQEKFRNFHNCQLKTYSLIFRIPIIDKGINRKHLTFDELVMMAPFIGLPNSIFDIFLHRDTLEKDFMKIFGDKGNFTVVNKGFYKGIQNDAQLMIIDHCGMIVDACPTIGNIFKQE